MKSTKLVVTVIASALLLPLGTKSACGQDYKAVVNAVCVSTNNSGKLVYQWYRNREIIRACAQENGLTNLMGLSLVYNRAADALQVVSGTNHTVICTPLSFAGGTWLSNSNNTKVERLAGVYVETNSMNSGTLAATERFTYSPSNTLSSFSLSGELQYTANGTNGPEIYKGRIVAGSRLRGFDDDGERCDHDGERSGDHR